MSTRRSCGEEKCFFAQDAMARKVEDSERFHASIDEYGRYNIDSMGNVVGCVMNGD